MNNLCYLSFLEGRMDLAVAQCQRAVALEPALKVARYNLALAQAGAGRMDLAAESLAAGGDVAEASFNLGILHLAQRDYRRAASAFDAASRARPTFNLARERALQARVLMHASTGTGTVQNDGDEKWNSLILARDAIPHPTAPQTLEESGLTLDLVLQLVLKMLHFSGELTGTELSRRIGLAFRVLSPAIDLLKAEQQLMIVGGGFVGGASYRYRITDAGRTRAALFLRTAITSASRPCRWRSTTRTCEAFRAAAPGNATQERIRRAFSHLVISDRVLDQLGPAINAGHSMFVYGPPGNGKTVISQAIRSLLDGDIVIPHALEVEGKIVRRLRSRQSRGRCRMPTSTASTAASTHDRRWVRCRRPMVMVGGELTLDALDLSYSRPPASTARPCRRSPTAACSSSTISAGRRARRRDLLNRWIVPLESRVDFLTLQTGQKFEMPFMMLVVFATNIRPAELVDEAFLRRIQYKIFAESPTTRISPGSSRTTAATSASTFEAGRDRTLARRVLPSAQHRAPRLPSARPDQASAVAGRATSTGRRTSHPTSSTPPATATSSTTGTNRRSTHDAMALLVMLLTALLQTSSGAARAPAPSSAATTSATGISVRITSPLGAPARTAGSGSSPRCAATTPRPSPVRFLIDQQLFKTDGGPPYVVEWEDENPFERREIAVEVRTGTAGLRPTTSSWSRSTSSRSRRSPACCSRSRYRIRRAAS